VQIDLVVVRRRELLGRQEQIAAAPSLRRIAIGDFSEADEQALVEGAAGADVQLLTGGRDVAGNGTGENTMAGREDGVRRIADDFYDDFAANAVCLADPPDDNERGRYQLRLFRLLGERNGAALELGGETRLVTLLQETGLAEQRADGVRGLRADVQPMVDAVGLEVDRLVARAGLILADDLDELAVAGALRVGDDDAVHGGLLTANTAKANLDCHLNDLLSGALPGLIAYPAFPDRTRELQV
jgi:hypothetical protein